MIANSLNHQNISLLHKMLSQNFYSCESLPLGIPCDGAELSLHHWGARAVGQQR